MDGTSIIQGRFTGTGNPIYLAIRQDIDWMRVYNYTIAHDDAPAGTAGAYYYWQRGMPAGEGLAVASTMTTGVAVNYGLDNPDGFTLIDSSNNTPIQMITGVTSISAATPPVVTVASTASLRSGDVIYMTLLVSGSQITTVPFEITVINGTTFSLRYMINSGAVPASAAGVIYKFPFPPQFYPRQRYITNMVVDPDNANQTRITLSVAHQYNVGEKVRLIVPSMFSLVNFNNVECTVMSLLTDATNNYINVDLPFATFAGGGTFTYPTFTSTLRLQPAQVVPVGENTALARALNVNEFLSAFNNRSFIGMMLGGGINTPGGASGDYMYWVAGKSYLNDATGQLVMTSSNL